MKLNKQLSFQYSKNKIMTDEFEERAKRLLNKLSSISAVTKGSRVCIDSGPQKTINVQQVLKISQDFEVSDAESRKKVKALTDQIKKMEISLNQEHESKKKAHDNFVNLVAKVQKQIKAALSNVKKNFQEKEKKLEQKIEAIFKSQKREIQNKFQETEELVEGLKNIETKIIAISEEIVVMRKNRIEIEQRINKQFVEQIRELKKIFEKDLHEREERQNQIIVNLKRIYKVHMEAIRSEEIERDASEKMLLNVVQQLANRIMES